MLGCPGLLITLFLPCLALYKHSNHSFYQCPLPFFITQTFPLTPGLPRGGGGGQFDRRIMVRRADNMFCHTGEQCVNLPLFTST